jgi:hypothetical protein
LVGNPEGNKAFGRPKRRWALKEITWKGMDWFDLAQDRDKPQAIVNAVMNIQVSYNVGNFLTG